MSIQSVETELSVLDERRESLRSQVISLTKEIEGIEEKLKSERESLNELKLQRKSLIEKRDEIERGELREIERKSRELKSKFSFHDQQTLNSSSSEEKVKSYREFQSEKFNSSSVVCDERKVQSLPTATIHPPHNVKRLSEDLPLDILKRCDSYAYCKECNEAMKLAKDANLVSVSVHTLKSTHERDSSEKEESASNPSKNLLHELLNKHSELPFHTSPSMNVCGECQQLYRVEETPSMHIPLCLSVDLCKTCASLRKASAVDAKCSFASHLTGVSCFSYDECEDCKIAHNLRRQNASERGVSRPITVHSTHRSMQRPQMATKARSTTNMEQSDSSARERTSKVCQSRNTCVTCSENSAQSTNDTSGGETPRNLREKLSFVVKRCQSHVSCINCQKLALLRDITASNASFEHPIETCASCNDCHRCRRAINAHPIETCTSVSDCRNCREVINNASRRSSLHASARRLSLRKTSDGKIINVVPSESFSKAETSIPDSDQLHRSRRHTNSPLSIEDHRRRLKVSSSLLRTCQSFGCCKACTECLANAVMPTKSIVATHCISQGNCDKCACVLSETSSEKARKSSKRKSPIYKISKLSARKSSDSESSSSGGDMMRKRKSKGSPSSQSQYEAFKSKIEEQNEIVARIQKKISKIGQIDSADKSLTKLRARLDTEKERLREMVQLAMYEQRVRRDFAWKPLTVALIDDLS